MAPRFKDLQIDVVGPMEQSEGMRYLLTVLDRTSRYYDAIPMASATASACASGFIRHWVAHFGLPFKATSDSGNVFISKLWKELHKELGSIVAYSPLYSPSSLGSVERIHKDIKASLKATLLAMGNEHKSKWMSVLPWTLLSRRTSYHSELQAHRLKSSSAKTRPSRGTWPELTCLQTPTCQRYWIEFGQMPNGRRSKPQFGGRHKYTTHHPQTLLHTSTFEIRSLPPSLQ